MVHSVDEGVGRIQHQLDALGPAENTIVIFFSDNGGFGPVTSMSPLRGSKGMLYEGGIRAPLIVKWPGVTDGGSSSDVPVIGIDLYPTILTMAGVAPPDDHPLDGVSLAPLLRGEAQVSERPLFWHFPAYLEADTSVSGPWRTTPAAAVRVDDDKLVTFFEDGRGELYDLAEDIGETRDLADKMPARAGRLRSILEQWSRDTDVGLPTETNPSYDPDHAASPGSPRSP